MTVTVKGTECKHARYFNNDQHDVDYIFVKLVDHMSDGTLVPRTEIIYNYERPFWITKERERDYKQKKSIIDINRCDRYMARQRDLKSAITRALRLPRNGRGLRQLLDNPYIFGAEVKPQVFVKQKFKDTYPDAVSEYKVAVWDTETDMVNPDRYGEIIILTYNFGSYVWVGIVSHFLQGLNRPIEKVKDLIEIHLKEETETYGLKYEFFIGNTPGQVAAKFVNLAMDQGPDWLAAWNINFDMNVLLRALKEEGYNLDQLFSHPSVPDELKYFDYIEGKKVKRIKSGTVEMSLSPEDQWHIAHHPAPFQFIDQMATYNFLRANVKGKELSYKLGYILEKNDVKGKLYMNSGSKYEDGTPEYHRDMQANFKIEYILYAIADSIRPNILDMKTKDLRLTLPAFLKSSDLADFNSNPSKLSDSMFFNRLKVGQVAGCVGTGMETEIDSLLYDKKDWIVTLPSFQIDRIGINVCEGLPGIQSQFVFYVSDLDCISSYPRTMWAANMSMETTRLEVAGVKGLPESTVRFAGINLTGGRINAWEIANSMLGFPGPDSLLKMYLKEKEKEVA